MPPARSAAPSLPPGWSARGTPSGTVYTPPWSTQRRPRGGGAPPASGGGFNPRAAMRRAGLTTRAAGGYTARRTRQTTRQLERVGALPNLGAGQTGVVGLLLFAFGTIIALALLDTALGGRGPAGVDRILSTFGRGIRGLFDANDPLVARGDPLPKTPGTAGPSSGGGGTPTRTDPRGPGAVAAAGKMLAAIGAALGFGLRVGENPYSGDPPDAGVHEEDSYHYRLFPGRYNGKPLGRAIDVTGPPDRLARFFSFVRAMTPAELIYDPMGSYFNGVSGGRQGGHPTHVHVAF